DRHLFQQDRRREQRSDALDSKVSRTFHGRPELLHETAEAPVAKWQMSAPARCDAAGSLILLPTNRMAEALARVLGAAVAAAVLRAPVAMPARAQDALPGGPATPGTPPRAAPSLVVVADVAGTETASAEVRAALYEIARSHGYEPAGTLDVQGAAARE